MSPKEAIEYALRKKGIPFHKVYWCKNKNSVMNGWMIDLHKTSGPQLLGTNVYYALESVYTSYALENWRDHCKKAKSNRWWEEE